MASNFIKRFFMFQGLSQDQAPPISVPFRFFLTAPIFGVLISLVLFFYPLDIVFNQYSPITIGLIHLFTLGVLVQIIFGAIMQMIPVLAGVVFKNPTKFANYIHISLLFGTLSLSGGFIFSLKYLFFVAFISLSFCFGLFFFTLIKLLFKVKFLTSTIDAMKIFSLTGLSTAILGFYLLGQHLGQNINQYHYIFVNIHILFASFAFALILIMGVSFQVIPMFYVALDFPKTIQKKLPLAIIIAIVLLSVFMIFGFNYSLIKLFLASFVFIFAYFGLKSLNNRKRPVFDVTLWYWKMSFYSLMIFSIFFIIGFNSKYEMTTLSIIFIFGFLYPLLQGMIYKIVPFLSWFHLSSNGYFMIPNLREYIDESMIKLQFFIYVSSFAFFILSTFFNQLFLYIASVLFLVSNLLFLFNLLSAIRKYNDKQKYQKIKGN
jgi:hypothetical protein